MSHTRWKWLMENDPAIFTPREILEGWHFCVEWDGLLVGPGMGELEPCSCHPKDHPVYQTIPVPELPTIILDEDLQ